MPTQLHRDIRFHEQEIDDVKRTIAKVESGRGTEKQAVLKGLRATLVAHEQTLADLERKFAERS